MDSIVSTLEKQFLGFPVWLWLGLILFLILLSQFLKRYNKPFLTKDLKKELRKDLNNIFNNFSQKLPAIKGCQLWKGTQTIGIVKRAVLMPKTIVEMVKEEKEKGVRFKERGKNQKITIDEIVEKIKGGFKQQAKLKKKATKQRFYGFVVFPKTLFGRIRFIFNFKGSFHLIDEQFVKVSGNYFIIENDVDFDTFLDVFIYSERGKTILTELTYKLTREIELQEILNFLPKQTYLETSIAGMVARYRELTELEKSKRSNEMEDLTKRET